MVVIAAFFATLTLVFILIMESNKTRKFGYYLALVVISFIGFLIFIGVYRLYGILILGIMFLFYTLGIFDGIITYFKNKKNQKHHQ